MLADPDKLRRVAIQPSAANAISKVTRNAAGENDPEKCDATSSIRKMTTAVTSPHPRNSRILKPASIRRRSSSLPNPR
jgi:hypothetical protein